LKCYLLIRGKPANCVEILFIKQYSLFFGVDFGMEKSKTKLLTVIFIALIILAAGVFFWSRDWDQKGREDSPLEFTDLNVVQFYLHMSGGDHIIGSNDNSFPRIMDAVVRAVSSINRPLPELGLFPDKSPPGRENGPDAGEPASIQDIESGAVSLSVWLIEPQKVNTGTGEIVTDRLLLVLGGKFQGMVFARDPASGNWTAWGTGSEGITKLAEIVRAGGL